MLIWPYIFGPLVGAAVAGILGQRRCAMRIHFVGALLAIALARTTLAQSPVQPPIPITPIGILRGTSVCLVRPSACNDESVVYRITLMKTGGQPGGRRAQDRPRRGTGDGCTRLSPGAAEWSADLHTAAGGSGTSACATIASLANCGYSTTRGFAKSEPYVGAISRTPGDRPIANAGPFTT